MRWKSMALLVAAAAIAVALSAIDSPFWGTTHVAHYTAQFHLKLTVSSIYEYRTNMGRWPTQIDDLELTSLPRQSPHWRYILEEELIIVVWPKTLKPDPKDNAERILAYYDKGLISERGQKWVCWGDLRTEYVKTEDLYTYLNKRPD